MTLEQRLSHPVSRPSDPAGLELRHLVALRAVAECGTFARAADCLGYTQSAVSQQVAALERVLGQKVFDRPGGPRPVVLTPSGRLLLERGEEILDRVAVTMADLAQVRDGERGRIRLGSFQSVSVHLAPPLLARLRAERPLVEVELFESDNDEELERRLLSGQLDATFLVVPPGRALDGVDATELFVDPYLVVVPLDEPEGPVAARSLLERPMIGNPSSPCDRLVVEGLRSQGIEVSYEFQTADNGAAHAMVRNRMGVAVMPLLAIDSDDPGVTTRELVPPVPARHVVIARRSGEAGPLTAALIDTAVAIVGELHLGVGSG